MEWIIGVGIATFFLGRWWNKRSCLKAFCEGYDDFSGLSWTAIKEKYQSFLSPMAPMDAASYALGLEYRLTFPSSHKALDIKEFFENSYKSGSITSTGTKIRKNGKGGSCISSLIDVDETLLDKMNVEPEERPIYHVYEEVFQDAP